jgi:hypothetical protein
MKRRKALPGLCFAAALAAGCALPLGEDYSIQRDSSIGITYITDYNLQTYVPIPKTGEPPVTILDSRGDLELTVVWKDAAGTEVALPFDAFAGNTVYQAEIKLTPRSGYAFYPSTPFTYPDGKINVQSDDREEPTRTVTVTYNNSDDADITFITNYNLQSYVPIPLAGEKPVTTLPGRADMTAAVIWKVEDSSNLPAFVPIPGPDYAFEEGKIYQADITLTASQNYRFIGERSFTYPGGMVTTPPADNNEPIIRQLTPVTYTETRKATVINDFNLTPYISKPISGIMPVISFAGNQYTGTVIWKKSGTQAVLAHPFQPDTEYTAEVSLTPVLGYTFTGVGQNSFIHTGAKTITGSAGSGEIRVDFLSTGSGGGPAVVYDTNLTGRIPKPISGEVPVLNVSGIQYTGSVTWVPAPHSTFQYGTVYTAVVALNPVPGYTFTGLRQNEFTHGEAPGGITNPADSGTVTIVFPATASFTLSTITSFGPVTKADSALKLIKDKKADNSVTIDLSGGEEEVEPGSVILEVGKNSPAKVIINGRGRVLKIPAQGTLLTVGGGVTLTLRNVTLLGTSGNNAPLVRVQGGKLILGDGAILTGNESTGDAGGVWVNGGELVLYNGAVIKGMKAARGGGVLIDTNGQFTMGGGIIGGEPASDGNRASGVNGGGGVLVADGIFDMLGGSIQSNTAEAGGSGGGVGILAGGTFNLHNGTIKSNSAGNTVPGSGAESGGGVFLMGNYNAWGTFNMHGGTIGGDNPADDANTAIIGGNGVCSIEGEFIMSGGIIQGNVAPGTDSYGVYAHDPNNPDDYYYYYNYRAYIPFTMTGSAQVDSGNKVFLSSYAAVTIGGGLSAEPAADIIRNDISSGTKLLRAGSSALITENYDKFLYNGLSDLIDSTAISVRSPHGVVLCWFGTYK